MPVYSSLIHLMSFIPGAEYVWSCLWPLRRRNSIAPKSFLSKAVFFRNSLLYQQSFSICFMKLQGGYFNRIPPFKWLTLRRPRNAVLHSASSVSQELDTLVAGPLTTGFFLHSRRQFRYRLSTWRCRPEYFIIVDCVGQLSALVVGLQWKTSVAEKLNS